MFAFIIVGVLSSPDAAAMGALLASLTAIGVAWMQGVKTRGAVTADVTARLDILDTKVDTILQYHVDHETRLRAVEKRNAPWE